LFFLLSLSLSFLLLLLFALFSLHAELSSDLDFFILKQSNTFNICKMLARNDQTEVNLVSDSLRRSLALFDFVDDLAVCVELGTGLLVGFCLTFDLYEGRVEMVEMEEIISLCAFF
jgi:hypothetical protein